LAERTFTPEEAERYLLSLELFGMRFGLDRMRRLMTALGSPHERFRSVQVLGTNGKSSTARMIAALLRRHGLKTGAYLSPHLRSFAERVEIDEHGLTPERFAVAIQRASGAAALVDRTLDGDDHVTQFEALTAAAYWELGRSGVEAAVIEAGLGGRYDATSVIAASVQVLTNIGLEHTRWLGPTERHIAEEKLAVVKAGSALVTGPLEGAPLEVAERVARDQRALLVRAGRDFSASGGPARFDLTTPASYYSEIVLRPLGRFQRDNFATAVAATETFLGGPLDPGAVRAAAREIVLPGRLEVVGRDPLVVLDGAHNPSGARALAGSLGAVVGERELVVVLSILEDKDAAGILAALAPLAAGAVFTRPSATGPRAEFGPWPADRRALPPAVLESLWRQLGGDNGEVVLEPLDALARARDRAGKDGAVLVTGSIYLLAGLVMRGAVPSSAAV
jgi:dihydrofolate synthase / folylpolyglutamate synthase